MIDFDLQFQYADEKTSALQQINGKVPQGRCIVLCGSSGCGKSTLLRCINGLIPQFYEGELKGFCQLKGKDISDMSIGEIGETAASVFQDPRSQFFTINSSTEVAFGLENHGVPYEEMHRRVGRAFEIFHLEYLRDRNVYELSGGERQMISILSAWAMDTDIFLLDEPTANLDFAAIEQLKSILLELKKQGKTIVFSEHRLYYLTDIADEYWVMAGGEITGRFPAEEMLTFSKQKLRELSLRSLDLEKVTVTERDKYEEVLPAVLSVSGLQYSYKRHGGEILSDVSFDVREKEVVALIGSNGCGKTTTGKIIAGLQPARSGSISLYGRVQKAKQLQKQVMFVMQEAEFQFFTNSVMNELLYGHRRTPEFEAAAEDILKSADMWKYRNRHPASLSGGQMQKLSLMIAALSDKPFIVLDEPTAGLDEKSLCSCAELIRQMKQSKTVVLITHDLELIAKVCDRCIAISGGQTDREFAVASGKDLQDIHKYMKGLHASQKKQGVRLKDGLLNPVTKLLYWAAVIVVISTSDNSLVFGTYAALIIMTAADGMAGTAVFGGGAFALLAAADALLPNTVFSFMLVLFPRIIAIGISMRTLIGRNEAGRTLAALRNLHLPERLIMICAVIFRFFPVLSGDMKLMRQSIRTRGAFVTVFQKLRALPEYMEILTVPMALRVIRIAETLSASAETRGIDLKRRKSNYLKLRFSAWDIVFTAILAAAVIYGILL